MRTARLLIVLLLGLSRCRLTKFLGVMSRHGARFSYTGDVTPEHKGELTNNGARMSYALGKYLRETYSVFFAEKFGYSESFILSSDSTRCRRTAEAIMMGIYDFGALDQPLDLKPAFLTPEWSGETPLPEFKSALPKGKVPVPIHALNEAENFAFRGWFKPICPEIHRRINVEDPAETAAMLSAMNAVLPKLLKQGFDYRKIVNVEKFESAHKWDEIPEFFLARKYLGDDLGLDQETQTELMRLHAAIVYYIYFRNPEVNRYLFTENARILVRELEEVSGRLRKEESVHRFLLMSGHDLNISLYLIVADLAKTDCVSPQGKCDLNPAFSSSLVFEVYEDDGQHYVETTLNGKAVAFCLSDSGQRCTLDLFISTVKSRMLPGDIETHRNAFCRLPPAPAPVRSSLTPLIVFSLAVSAVLGLILRRVRRS